VVTIAASLERDITISMYYSKAHDLHFILAESLVNISPRTPVKTTSTNVHIFTYVHCAPTHPPANVHKISEVTGPQFIKFLLDTEESSAVLMQ